VVSVTVWLLDWARGHLRAHGRLVGEAARASYATHLVHPLVLTAVGVMLAAVPPATELKFVLVSLFGILTCFTAGWIMTKTPGVGKLL
jgi:glucans biosynthesis protein C